jgi:abortive infection bacteriophage resistance protein
MSLNRSTEDFLHHYNNKYSVSKYPPGWMTIEILSFGQVSKLYSSIKNTIPEKKKIAKTLGLPTYDYLQSWTQSISVLRNHCAHHSRIWNRIFINPPKSLAYSNYNWLKKLPDRNEDKLVYYGLCLLKFFLNIISPGNHFTMKITELFKKYKTISELKKLVGFPDGWEEEELLKI